MKRIGYCKIVETRTEDGKIILVRSFTLSPDERSLTIASTNPETKSTFSITAQKYSRTLIPTDENQARLSAA